MVIEQDCEFKEDSQKGRKKMSDSNYRKKSSVSHLIILFVVSLHFVLFWMFMRSFMQIFDWLTYVNNTFYGSSRLYTMWWNILQQKIQEWRMKNWLNAKFSWLMQTI